MIDENKVAEIILDPDYKPVVNTKHEDLSEDSDCPACGGKIPLDSTECQDCGWSYCTNNDPEPDTIDSPIRVHNAESKTCGLAVIALILAILSIFFNLITAVPAIICAIIAQIQINKSEGRLKGGGMVFFSIVASILVPLIAYAIVVPQMNNLKGKAHRIVCGTNLRGLGMAVLVYAWDYEELLPTADRGF